MTWLYVLASVVLFAAPLAGPLAQTSGMAPVMQALAEQTGVPNLVSGVILETRLFDTIGEVVVFTLASIGTTSLLGMTEVDRNARLEALRRLQH